MDPQQIFGVLLGGTVVCALGAVAEYMREKETFPNYRALGRDFIIGAVLVVFILQVLPESMSNVLAFLPTMKSIGDSMPSMSVGGSVEPDLQVGPARF
jgi:hypothetical protein